MKTKKELEMVATSVLTARLENHHWAVWLLYGQVPLTSEEVTSLTGVLFFFFDLQSKSKQSCCEVFVFPT